MRSVYVGTVAVGALALVTSVGVPAVRASAGRAATSAVTAQAVATAPGTFVPLAPARLLDTGSGIGAPKAPVRGGATINVQVDGRGGVPTSGVSAVALNVTVAAPVSGGHVTVFPEGTSRPATSSLNFVAGQTVANAVVVRVGSTGGLSLYNNAARSLRLIADVAGYYLSGTPSVAGAFASLAPARILDTAAGTGAPRGAVAAGATIDLGVSGRGGVPSSGVTGVVLNLTVASPTAGGHITAFPAGSARPTTSSVNFPAGHTVPNLVVVGLGSSGDISLYNSSHGTVRLIADVAGYVLSGTPGVPGAFRTLAPRRFLDTGNGTGAPRAPVAADGTVNVQITGRGSVPSTGVSAVVLNVTVAAPRTGGHITVYPAGSTRPATSSLNFARGQTIANLVVAKIDSSGRVSLYNSSNSSVRLIADVAGYYLASTATSGTSGPGPIEQPTSGMPTADPLPTVQIDGVAWKQVVVGNTVFVGGNFANARPAGAAPGVNTVPRTDLLAYDITTGTLITSFDPVLDGQVLNLAVSPNGTRLFVVGDFTTVNGQAHQHIAEFQVSTGALISTFTASLDNTTRAVAATNGSVYVGGSFSMANGVARTRLAAFTIQGALTTWRPKADAVVNDLVLDQSGTQVDIAGAFTDLDKSPVYGIGAVSATSGVGVAFAVNQSVQAYGRKAGFTSLSISGNTVYGTAYNYHGTGNLEGAFSADSSTGALNWLEDCHGDSYGAYGGSGAVFVVSHAHYCQDVGGWPLYSTNHFRRTMAFTQNATGTLLRDPTGYPGHTGLPAPSIYEWFPDLTTGTATGQNQAAWAVSGNGTYVVEAGEFPTVNGVGQQGLVRFAAQPTAPGHSGPALSGAGLNPEITNGAAGSLHVAFQSDWDRDDHTLTYQVVRDGVTNVLGGSVDATWWDRPMLGFTDSGLTPGQSYRYRVTYTDPDGNTASSYTVTATPSATTALSTYDQQVISDGATSYWPLDESGGAIGFDHAGYDDLDESGGVTQGANGPVPGETASTFSGSATGFAANRAPIPGPTTFSLSAWVRTTSTAGGKIVGFGNNPNGVSSTTDRHIYLDDSGLVHFGVLGSGKRALVSSTKKVNDGSWHQIVATFSPNLMQLYLDGVMVTQRKDITPTTPGYSGWWRIGGDTLTGWANAPTSGYLAGSIASVAVYPDVISASTVAAEYAASGR